MKDTDYTEFSYLGTDYTAEYTYDYDSGLIEVTRISYGDDRDADFESMHYAAILSLAEASAENDLQNRAERAYERQQARLLEDPPESYESVQRKNRIDKDGFR